MTRDLVNNLAHFPTLVPAARLTGGSPYNGVAVDTQGAESAEILIIVGAPGVTFTGGGIGIEFQVQQSANGTSGWTAVADADLTAPVTAANGATVTGSALLLTTGFTAATTVSVGYQGIARYLRVVEVHTGTQATGTPTAVLIVCANYAYRPVGGNPT